MIPAAGIIRSKTISGKMVEFELIPKIAPESPSNVDMLSKKSEKSETKSPAPKVRFLKKELMIETRLPSRKFKIERLMSHHQLNDCDWCPEDQVQ